MKTLTHLTGLMFLGTALGACGEEGILLAEVLVTAQQGAGSNEAPGPSEEEPAGAPQRDVRAIEELLMANCGSCHGPAAPPIGGITDIGDVYTLVAASMLIPGVPEDSPILTRMQDGSMPPVASGLPRVSEVDIEWVSDFIRDFTLEQVAVGILLRDCGACHSNGVVFGGIADIADIDALIDATLIIPGNRLDSVVYTRMASGTMPPLGSGIPRVSDRDVELIGIFIESL